MSKVIITKKDEFTSKKSNVAYVKLSYLDLDGNAGTVLATKEKFDGYEFSDDKILPQDHLKGLFDNSEVVSLDFDQNGFLTGISK